MHNPATIAGRRTAHGVTRYARRLLRQVRRLGNRYPTTHPERE